MGERRDSSLAFFFGAFWPFLGALLLLLLIGSPAEASRKIWPRRDILDAIRFVESSGRDNPPDGDGGRAIGPYQIHRVYWLDATQFDAKLGGTYQDCRKRPYAEQVIDAYMRRYARAPWARGEAEIIARIHNGGPQGAKKRATLPYWQRVKRRLPP